MGKPYEVDRDTWECPNHHHCGAWAYLITYNCGCVRVKWQDRGHYDPKRCAHNPEEEYGPCYPKCTDRCPDDCSH